MTAMDSTKYIYWQDQGLWLGYLQDYPDYWTQGQSLEDLESHLRDLYQDLTSGEIPGVRKLADCRFGEAERPHPATRSGWLCACSPRRETRLVSQRHHEDIPTRSPTHRYQRTSHSAILMMLRNLN